LRVRKRKQKPQIIEYIVLIILAFIFIYPMWHCLVLSFADKKYAVEAGFKFWPPRPTLAAYKSVFSTKTLYVGYANTLFRTVFGTLLTLVVTYCGAYAMRYKNMPGHKVLNFLILFTMYFGGGAVPSYILIRDLGLLNNRLVYILPGAVGAYNLFVMRSFINSLGTEMEESAYIDGANPLQILFRIYLPLSKAIMAVVGLWSVVGHWNSYMDNVLYATKPELLLLQTVIRNLTAQVNAASLNGNLYMATQADMTPVTVQYATVMAVTLPILIAYPYIQKYLVKGTMIGALKG